MSSRTFTDENGIAWTVWEVSPQWAERRSGRDRRADPAAALRRPSPQDRRRGPDRRRHQSNGDPRVRIDPRLCAGWLAFEGDGIRRRLSPIPAGWAQLPESELSALCDRASPVRVRRGRLID